MNERRESATKNVRMAFLGTVPVKELCVCLVMQAIERRRQSGEIRQEFFEYSMSCVDVFRISVEFCG